MFSLHTNIARQAPGSNAHALTQNYNNSGNYEEDAHANQPTPHSPSGYRTEKLREEARQG